MAETVGGAAAAGIQSGVGLGLQLDREADNRNQRQFENQRQTQLDTERQIQTSRSNARQDKQDANADDDRALTAVNSEMQDHALYGAGLSSQYGGPANIPGDVGSAYATKANDIGSRRTALLEKRYAPQVKAEQQWAQDTSSRIAAGQMSMDDLSPADTVRLLQATSRRPVADFLAPPNGKSKIAQAIDDTTAGIQTQNPSLTIQGANTLLAPELQTGIGHVTPDGSQITGKSLYALVPAPQNPSAPAPAAQGNPIQGLAAALTAATAPPPPAAPATGVGGAALAAGTPGGPPGPPADDGSAAPAQTAPVSPGGPAGAQPLPPQAAPAAGAPGGPPGPPALTQADQPGKVMPVLQVTAQHPDGTEVTYHAPVTVGRGTGPNDTVAPPLDMGDAMERMGKLGTLEAWANTPQARAKIDQGLKDLGGDANSFLGAYYAMHGDAKALLSPGSNDPTSLKIAAIQKMAKDQGVSFEDAARMLDGRGKTATGLASQIDAIQDYADENGLSLEAAGKKMQQLGLLKTPKGGGTGVGGAAGPAAAAGPGGTSARYGKDADYSKQVDYWAGVLAQGGTLPPRFAQSAEGKQMFGDIVKRVPQISNGPGDILANQVGLGGDKAAARAAGTKGANIEMASAEFDQLATLAKSAAAAVPRADFVPWNQLVELVQNKTSSPEQGKFAAANLALVNTYARAISPSGVPTVHDKQHAQDMLSTAVGTPRYNAVVDQMTQEINAARQSPDRVKALQRARTAGTGLNNTSAAPGAPAAGTVQQGYRFKGGDPAQQTNWERVQ